MKDPTFTIDALVGIALISIAITWIVCHIAYQPKEDAKYWYDRWVQENKLRQREEQRRTGTGGWD